VNKTGCKSLGKLGIWTILLTLLLVQASHASEIKNSDPLLLLNLSERNVAGKNQICALFSTPLERKTDFQPYFALSAVKQGIVDGAWVLSKNGKMACFSNSEPQTQYSVTVYQNLPAANGSVLKENQHHKLKTRRLTPAISFDTRGSVFLADLGRGLPVVTVNVPQVDVTFHRVNSRNMGEVLNLLRSYSRYRLARNVPKFTELIYTGRFDLDAPRNTRVKRAIALDRIPQLKQPGLYLAVMKPSGSYTDNPKITHFTITDIGLHARVYPGQLDIYSASLKTGKPMAGVTIGLLDKSGRLLQESRTSPDGQASFISPSKKSRFLIARNGRHQSLLKLRGPALDLSDFDLGKQQQQKQELFIYSERDLYRPGETLHLNALLRNHDGHLQAAPPLQARLLQPDNRVNQSFTWHAQQLAFYSHTFTIPGNAPTGDWQLQVDKPDGKKAHYRFKVEEFLPERMKLTFAPLGETSAATNPDQTVELPLLGEYLYGAPASGNRLSTMVNISNWRSPVEALKNFQFGDINNKQGVSHFELGDATLNAQGEAILKLESRWKATRSPLRVKFISSLFESGGRPVVRSHSHLVWPTEAMVGIRPEFKTDENAQANSRVRFDLIKATRTGELRAAKGLEAVLIREDRQYFWEYSTSRGWHYEHSESEYPVFSETLSIEVGITGKIEVPVEWGHYRLEVTDPETSFKSSLRFVAGYDWYRRWQQSQQDGQSARPDQVSLALDKDKYRPGDTAKLHIEPPHDGEALILVESDRPLWTHRQQVKKGGTTIDIPVDKTWDRHDTHISVLTIRKAGKLDAITPSRAFGLVHLPLDRSNRKLELTLQAPEKSEPLQSLTTQVTVSGNEEEEVFVTLAAVDVGVLNITDYKTPDPFEGFFQRRRYTIESRDLYGALIELNQHELASFSFGGDGPSRGGKRPASEVQIVSLFSGPVKLDASGKADIRLDVPDFNGRLRLMALAFNAEQFGSSEREITIAAPVVTQLAMPRFIAGGDHSTLALNLHNLSGKEQKMQVHLDADLPLQITQPQHEITLANGEKGTLSFPVLATKEFKPATIKLAVKGGQLRDFNRQWQLGVRPAFPAITRSQHHAMQPQASLSLDTQLMDTLVPSSVESKLVISDSIDLDVAEQMKHLLRYPYGCLEQTSSSAYPWVYATDEAITRFGIHNADQTKRIKSIEIAMGRLQAKQRPNGSFGLWSNTAPEEHWLSAYVADFLLNAEGQGLAVSQPMKQKVLRRLSDYLRSPSLGFERYSENRNHYQFAYRSYAAFVLSRLKSANLGRLRELFDREADKSRTGLPLLHLGLALLNQGDHKRGKEAIKKSLNKIYDPGYYGDYGSPIRDTAMMIHLLIKQGLNRSDTHKLALQLVDKIRERRYFSTQERNAIFLAGIALKSDDGSEWQASMVLGELEKKLQQKGVLHQNLEYGELQHGLSLKNRSNAPLWVDLSISGYPNKAPEPVSNGMSIARQYYNRSGEPIELKQLNVGDLVLVHIAVNTQQRHQDGLVVDLLPAGLELENQNLNHAIKLDEFKIDGKTIKELQNHAKITHQEYRDDRYVAAVDLGHHWQTTHLFYLVRAVTPGFYQVPPPFVEDMYRPEKHAIGETPKRLQVINKALADQ